MDVLRIKSCCCCSSLRTGSKVIALMGLFFGTLGVVSTFGLLFELSRDRLFVGLVRLFSAATMLFISGSLLHGTRKNKPAHVIPWLAVEGFFIVMAALAYVAYLAGVVTKIRDHEVILVSVMFILLMALWIYIYAVVYSFYAELKAEEARLPATATDVALAPAPIIISAPPGGAEMMPWPRQPSPSYRDYLVPDREYPPSAPRMEVFDPDPPPPYSEKQ